MFDSSFSPRTLCVSPNLSNFASYEETVDMAAHHHLADSLRPSCAPTSLDCQRGFSERPGAQDHTCARPGTQSALLGLRHGVHHRDRPPDDGRLGDTVNRLRGAPSAAGAVTPLFPLTRTGGHHAARHAVDGTRRDGPSGHAALRLLLSEHGHRHLRQRCQLWRALPQGIPSGAGQHFARHGRPARGRPPRP